MRHNVEKRLNGVCNGVTGFETFQPRQCLLVAVPRSFRSAFFLHPLIAAHFLLTPYVCMLLQPLNNISFFLPFFHFALFPIVNCMFAHMYPINTYLRFWLDKCFLCVFMTDHEKRNQNANDQTAYIEYIEYAHRQYRHTHAPNSLERLSHTLFQQKC